MLSVALGVPPFLVDSYDRKKPGRRRVRASHEVRAECPEAR